MNLPYASYQVIYNQKDITTDVSADVLSIDYTDKVRGETDEVSISMQDKFGLWRNAWYPDKGSTLQLFIRKNLQQLDCGLFQIDQTEYQKSVDGTIFTLKGIAAGITKKMRTKNTYAHQDKSLREIANTVASNLGLTLDGTIQDIRIHRVNQYRETDLSFLNRIAGDYGYIFSVRGDKLIFTYYKDIETREASFIINASDLLACSFRDTTFSSYKKSRVRHHNSQSKELVEYEVTETDPALDSDREDDNEMYDRAENKQQAEAKCTYGLYKNNSKAMMADITIPGNLLCVSGNNVEIRGWGKYSGVFHIIESTHNINRDSSYQCSAQIKRVKLIDSTLY